MQPLLAADSSSAFDQAVASWCAQPLPAGREALEATLLTTRRLINQMELFFARAAAALVVSRRGDVCEDHDSAWQWLRDECRMTVHAAHVAVEVGEQIDVLPRSAAALAEGRIGMAHLGYMADAAQQLHGSSTASGGFDEGELLPAAQTCTVQRFRRECRQLIHRRDHAGFVRGETDDTCERNLNLTHHEDGSLSLEGWLDPEGSGMLHAVLDPLSRKASSGEWRSIGLRRADALVETLRRLLDSGTLPVHAGQRPHLHVTTTLETLQDLVGAPAGQMESGALLSGTAVQRLACDSTVIRVLLDSRSQVVDVGRAARVVPPATRRALNLRDGGCVWPGCERPASSSQAHHLVHWVDGGLTDLSNLVLLCQRHHWMVHEGGWVLVRDGDGHILTFACDWPTVDPRGRDPTGV